MQERRSGLSTRLKIALSLGLIVLLVPFIWPERARIPVAGANARYWNKKSFFRGRLGIGGNVVAVLGPKWRIHYFAHLRDSNARLFELVGRGEVIGTVGNSGNAAGKAPHLHDAILQLLPQVWKATRGTQGWKRMFFVDPGEVIK